MGAKTNKCVPVRVQLQLEGNRSGVSGAITGLGLADVSDIRTICVKGNKTGITRVRKVELGCTLNAHSSHRLNANNERRANQSSASGRSAFDISYPAIMSVERTG
jgi:hypothetical protein